MTTLEHPPLTRTVDGTEVPAAGTYAIDASHTEVGFSVRHLMVSKTKGRFGGVSGTVTIAEDPSQSAVEVEIDAASIDTRDPGATSTFARPTSSTSRPTPRSPIARPRCGPRGATGTSRASSPCEA